MILTSIELAAKGLMKYATITERIGRVEDDFGFSENLRSFLRQSIKPVSFKTTRDLEGNISLEIIIPD